MYLAFSRVWWSCCFTSIFSDCAGSAFTRKDVIYSLGNTSDPETSAAIKAFQREQFAAAGKGEPAAAAEPELELAAQVERKYMSAQNVESGIQVRCLPVGCTTYNGIDRDCSRSRLPSESAVRHADHGSCRLDAAMLNHTRNSSSSVVYCRCVCLALAVATVVVAAKLFQCFHITVHRTGVTLKQIVSRQQDKGRVCGSNKPAAVAASQVTWCCLFVEVFFGLTAGSFSATILGG